MAIINNKNKNLPTEVWSYLVSMKATELNILIENKNKINSENRGKITEIVNLLFTKELKVSDLPLVIKNNYKLNDLDAKALACDIVGIRLLVIKDWLKEDLETYIKNWGGNPADYLHFVDEQKKALAEEAKFFAEESKVEPEFVFKPKSPVTNSGEIEIDEEQEKIDSAALFSKGLVNLLKDQDANEFIADYNIILISLIGEDAMYRQTLETALYANSDELTSNRILLDDREVAPSIANWLKDFLKLQGSEMFDDLALAQYLSTSVNAKKLNPTEKDLLRKLLRLYRNLSFFPASMENTPMEDWQIIPVVSDALSEEKPVAKIRPAASKVEPIKSQISNKVDNKIDPLSELQTALSKYVPDSLEYKAVVQEIKRLKKKK